MSPRWVTCGHWETCEVQESVTGRRSQLRLSPNRGCTCRFCRCHWGFRLGTKGLSNGMLSRVKAFWLLSLLTRCLLSDHSSSQTPLAASLAALTTTCASTPSCLSWAQFPWRQRRLPIDASALASLACQARPFTYRHTADHASATAGFPDCGQQRDLFFWPQTIQTDRQIAGKFPQGSNSGDRSKQESRDFVNKRHPPLILCPRAPSTPREGGKIAPASAESRNSGSGGGGWMTDHPPSRFGMLTRPRLGKHAKSLKANGNAPEAGRTDRMTRTGIHGEMTHFTGTCSHIL